MKRKKSFDLDCLTSLSAGDEHPEDHAHEHPLIPQCASHFSVSWWKCLLPQNPRSNYDRNALSLQSPQEWSRSTPRFPHGFSWSYQSPSQMRVIVPQSSVLHGPERSASSISFHWGRADPPIFQQQLHNLIMAKLARLRGPCGFIMSPDFTHIHPRALQQQLHDGGETILTSNVERSGSFIISPVEIHSLVRQEQRHHFHQAF